MFGARIHHTQADLAVGECFPYNFHVPRARCGIFQDKLFDSYLLEAWDKRFVISREQHLLRAAPVSAADMKACPSTFHLLDDPVKQFRCILQFTTRIPAGGKSRSHERTPIVLLGKYDLGKHRLVELYKLASLIH